MQALLCRVLTIAVTVGIAPATARAAAPTSSPGADGAQERPYTGPVDVAGPTQQADPQPPGDGDDAALAREQPGEPADDEGYEIVTEAEPEAELVPIRHSLVYKNLLAARYNPLGLVNELTLGWRMQLFTRPGVLFQDSYLGVKAHTFVNPAFARVGPTVEFQPLAVLNLSATYDYVGYYSSFDQFMSFRTPTADYRDTRLEELGEAGENYPTTGHLVTLSALAQAKVRNIAIRDNVKFYYADFDMRDGDTVYYDQTLDILEPNQGWAVVNDLDLIWLFDFGLKLGARYTLTHAFYQQKHFLPGEPRSEPNGPTHRVGPALLYTFYDKPERRFNKPTVILLSQWWARHRWRTGVDVHAAVPYLVVGFLFEGDLLPDPRKRERR